MTFDQIGDDCSLCPLSKEGICRGLVNYGSGPVFPPCSENPEMDADACLESIRAAGRRMEEERKQKAALAAKEARRKELKKMRRRISDAYCRKEINEVKQLEKLLRHWEDAGSGMLFDLTFAESMEKGGIPIGDTEQMREGVLAVESRTEQIRASLEKAKERLAAKRLEAQKTERYQAVGRECALP